LKLRDQIKDGLKGIALLVFAWGDFYDQRIGNSVPSPESMSSGESMMVT